MRLPLEVTAMAEPVMIERPAGACLLCLPPIGSRAWPRALDGYRTCDLCLDRLGATLLDVVVRYQRLNPAPGAGADPESRRPPGFGSRSPISEHVVVMRDPRSKSCEVARDGVHYVWDPHHEHTLPDGVHGPLEPPGAYVDKREVWYGSDGRPHSEQSRPPLSIPFTLASLASLIAEEREMATPRGTLSDVAVWLDKQLDWVARQEWVAYVDQRLRRLQGQLKPVTGDPRIYVARCPNTLDTGEHTQVCDAKLYYSPGSDVIACGNPACRRRWTRDRWDGDSPDCLLNLVKVRRATRAAA